MSTRSVNRSPIRLEENPSETGQCSEDATPASKTSSRRGRGRPFGSKNKRTAKSNEVVLNINISKEDTSEGEGKAPFILNLGDIISSLCASGGGVDKKCTINITHNGSKISDSSVIRNSSLNRTPDSNNKKTNKNKRAEESFSPAITSSQKKRHGRAVYKDVYSDSESDHTSLHLTDGEEDCGDNEDAKSVSSMDIFEEGEDKSNKTKPVPEKKNAASKSIEKPTTGRYSIRSWLMKSNNVTSTPVSRKDNNDLNSTDQKNNENNVLLKHKSGDESDSSTHELANEIIECLKKDKCLNIKNSSVTEKLNGSNSKNSKFRKFTKTRFSLRKSNSEKNVNNKNASSDEEVDLRHGGENGTEKLSNGDSGASVNELSTPRNCNNSEKKINGRSSVRKKVTVADKSPNQERSNVDVETTRSENSARRYSLRSSVKKQPVVVLKKLEASDLNKNLKNKKNTNTKNAEPSTSGLSHLSKKNLKGRKITNNKNASCSKGNNSGSESDSSDEKSWDGDVNSTDNESATENGKRTSNSNHADSIVVEISNNCNPMGASLPENNLNTEKNIDEELLASQNIDTPSKLDILSQETHSNLVLIPVEERENVRLVESVVQRILVSPDKNKSAANVNLQVQNEKDNSENVNDKCLSGSVEETNSKGGNSDKNDELESETNKEINSEVLVNEKNSATSLNISSNKQCIIGEPKEKNKSSNKLPAVTSSTDYENLNSKESSQMDKNSDRSVNENNLVSNNNCDNPNKVIPDILMSEFNKKLAMISEITSTQNDDDNKSTNSDKLVIDESLNSADVVNNPVDESNLQEKVVNENESVIQKDQSDKGKKRKDSCESSPNFRESMASSKMFQKADEIIKNLVEQNKINRSELLKNKTLNEIDRHGKAVGKNLARGKGNNSSIVNSENSDSEESSGSSSASEIKSNRTKLENLIERGDKYEKNNSGNGPVKHRISIENGCLKQKPDVEERKSQESSGSDAESSSDSEDESARLPTEKKNMKEEYDKKNKVDLMKKSESIHESDSDSDSDEEKGKNKKLQKSRSAEEISRVKENLKKQLLAEEKGSEESSNSDSDSSDGEADKIQTLQKSSSSEKPAAKTKENSNQQLAGGKHESSSESDTDSSSDSDSNAEKKNEVEANGKINSINRQKKHDDTRQRESDLSSSESENDDEADRKKNSADFKKKPEDTRRSKSDSSSSESESDDASEKHQTLVREKVSEADKKANSAESQKTNENVRRNESSSSSSESESEDNSEKTQTSARKKVIEADRKTSSEESQKKRDDARRSESESSSSESESDSDSEKNKTSARKKVIEAEKNHEDTRRDESESDNDAKKNQTCSKDILSNENLRNEKDGAQSKTPSLNSSDDESVEVKDQEIQIDGSKIEEAIRDVSTNSELLPKTQGNELPKRKMSIQRSPAASICISSEDDDSDSVRKKQDNEILSPVRIEKIIQIKNSPGQKDFLDARKRRLSKSLESIYSLEKGEVVSRTLGTEVKEDEGTPVKEIPTNDSLTFSVGSDSDVQFVRETPKASGENISKQLENQKEKKSKSKEKDKSQNAANTSLVENPLFEGFGDKSSGVKENSRTKKLPQGAKRKKSKKEANKSGLPSSKKIKVDDEIPIIDLEKFQLEILKKVMLTRAAAAAKAAKDLENKEEVDSAKLSPKKLTRKEKAKGSADAKEAAQSDNLDKEKEVKKLLQEVTSGLALEDDTEEAKKEVKRSPAKKIQKEIEKKVKNSTDEPVKLDEEEVAEKKAIKSATEEVNVSSIEQEKSEEEIIKPAEKEIKKSAKEEVEKSPKKKDKKSHEKTDEVSRKDVINSIEEEPVASLSEEAEEKVEEEKSKLSEEEVKKSAQEDVEKLPKKKDKKSVKTIRKEVKKPVEEELDSSSNEEGFEERVEEEINKSAEKEVKKSTEKKAQKSAEDVEKSPKKKDKKSDKAIRKEVVKSAEKELVGSSSEEDESEDMVKEKIIKSTKKKVKKSAKDAEKSSKKKTEKLNGKTDILSREEGIKSVKEDGAKKRFEKDEAEPVEMQKKKNKKAKKSTSIINQSDNDIQPLPGHIVSKLEPTKPPMVKKFEKPVKKLKRKANEDIMDDEESHVSKKIATGDYIPLEVSGPTKFGIAPLNKFKKALPYSHHAAANFKTQMLYGDRNRRLPSGKLNVIKEKQNFTK